MVKQPGGADSGGVAIEQDKGKGRMGEKGMAGAGKQGNDGSVVTQQELKARRRRDKRAKLLSKWWDQSSADLSADGWGGGVRRSGEGAHAICHSGVGESIRAATEASRGGAGAEVDPWPLSGPSVGGGEVLWKVSVGSGGTGWGGEGVAGWCVFGAEKTPAIPILGVVRDSGGAGGVGGAGGGGLGQERWEGWLKCIAPAQVVVLEQGYVSVSVNFLF